MSDVSASVPPTGDSGAQAPAPEQQQQQTMAPPPEPVAEAPQVQQTQQVAPPVESVESKPPETKSVLGDLLSDGESSTSDNDYNYDYDDIQLENGVVSSSADKGLVNSIARELGLSREQARKLYERGGSLVKSAQQEQRNAIIEQWNQQIQSDPEVGGANLNQSIANFKAAMREFGSPELRQMLTQYPIYQSPAFFKFFAKAGKAISSDNNFTQSTGAPPQKLSEKEEFLRQFPNSGYLLDDNFRN